MRRKFALLFIGKLLTLGGCAHTSATDTNSLPSLIDRNEIVVVQVLASASTTRRDHPYYIVCNRGGCPEYGTKTKIETTPIVTVTTSPVKTITKAQTIDGRNATYRKKTETLLPAFRIYFDYASATVTDVSKAVLAKFVHHYPHQHRRVRVTGFTDNDARPTASVDNEWLALERARQTRDALINLGYPASQLLLEGKFLCCYIVPNKTAADRQLNRRAELFLISTQ